MSQTPISAVWATVVSVILQPSPMPWALAQSTACFSLPVLSTTATKPGVEPQASS